MQRCFENASSNVVCLPSGQWGEWLIRLPFPGQDQDPSNETIVACVESFALCHVALLWFYSLNLFCNVSFALHLILFFVQKCHRISEVNTSALASALLIASRMIFLFQFCFMVCCLCFPRHIMHQVIHCTPSIQVMNFLIMSFLWSRTHAKARIGPRFFGLMHSFSSCLSSSRITREGFSRKECHLHCLPCILAHEASHMQAANWSQFGWCICYLMNPWCCIRSLTLLAIVCDVRCEAIFGRGTGHKDLW